MKRAEVCQRKFHLPRLARRPECGGLDVNFKLPCECAPHLLCAESKTDHLRPVRSPTKAIVRFPSPAPSSLIVLLDEDEYSINDAGFAIIGPKTPFLYQMIDWPATYHNNAAGFAFADGHSEIKKWTDHRTKVYKGNVRISNQKDNKDIVWMSERASALRNK